MKAENFKICYRKLKSHAYFDKAEGILRKQIVQFESKPDFEEKIEKLYNTLKCKQDKEWNDFLNKQLKKIRIYKFPKKIDNDRKDEIIINMEHNQDVIKVTEDNIQYRIGMPIEMHILSIIWIENIGRKLDEEFANTSYGNRLLIQQNINESDNNISEKWSPYLYKPYFNEYESWRDKGLEVAEKCYREKEDCLIIMLDIKRFFYSVSLKPEMFDNFIDGASKENARLNELVFKVCEKYSEIIHRITNDKNKNIFLPIGFLPSAILANWYLDEFDKNIIDRVNPDYYGRYVDDMIIVHKIKGNSELKSLLSKEYVSKEEILNNYFIDFKQQNLIKNSLITPNKDDNVRSGEKTYQINFFDEFRKESKLEINDNKIKIFYLKAGGTKALIDKFKESIKNNSSEFRLLPDGNNIFLDNYNDIYKLKQNESINSLRGIEDIKIDKYELSKFIGKNLTVANLIKDASESKFYDDLEKIFQPSIIIENYLLWESILNLCIVNKRLDKFKSFTDNIINAISMINKDEEVNNKSIDIKNTLINYLFSCILRSSSLVWGDEIQSSIESVVSLALNKYNISVKAKGLIEDFSTFKFYSSKSEIKKIEFYTDKNKKILNDIDNIRRGFLSTRMIQKSNVSILIDMFANNEGKIDLYGKSLYLNDLNQSIEYIAEFVFDKKEEELPLIKSILKNNADKNLYRYRPYLITMQDLSKLFFISEAIKGKTLSEESYKSLKIKSVSVMIEKLYYSINFFRRFTKSVGKQTKKKNSMVSFKEIDKSYNKNSISSSHSKPNYNIIKIGKGNKSKIKVAIATATNYDKNFEGVLLDETNRSLKRYNELSEIIRQTVKGGANILVLPENYVPFEWLGLLERECKKNNMAIITGVEHIKIKDKVYNLIASLFPYEYKEYKFIYTNLRNKVWYSPEEKRQIEGYAKEYVEGNEYNLFVWNNIWIPVYCCFEIASIIDRSSFFSLADLFVAVEWNRDINYFDNIIESLNRDMHCYCVQVNTANYGDSCLVQPTKSYNHIMLKTKGGINSCVLIEEIDIDKLRRFQIKEYELQKNDKFKPTPPNFNKDIVYAKIKNNLFEQIK